MLFSWFFVCLFYYVFRFLVFWFSFFVCLFYVFSLVFGSVCVLKRRVEGGIGLTIACVYLVFVDMGLFGV